MRWNCNHAAGWLIGAMCVLAPAAAAQSGVGSGRTAVTTTASAVGSRQSAVGRAQAPAEGSLIPTVERWIRLPIAAGRERFATDRIQAVEPGWKRDANGDLVMKRGSGAPVRVVACGLDAPAYVVSEIRSDGYLRVQTDGSLRGRPLWNEFNEGQRELIMTGNRATPGRVKMVPAVFAVRSIHLLGGRPPHPEPTTIDDLWLDVGAQSAAEVRRMGIRLLDPLFRDLPPWRVGDDVTGPDAASRAGCAAVAAAARGTPAHGTTVFVLSAQNSFGWTGLLSVIAHTGSVDTLFVVVPPAGRGADTTMAVREGPMRLAMPAAFHVGVVRAIAVRSTDPNTLIERVSDADLHELFARVAQVADVGANEAPVNPDDSLPEVAEPHDSLSAYANLLARLSNRYAVSGHEAPVRELIRSELPAWARPLAKVDTAGNLFVPVGPDRDTIVIVAHMDEIGFDVQRIEPDGRVALGMRGGFLTTLYTGQQALLHRDGDPQGSVSKRDCAATSASALHGVFEVPQESTAVRGVEGRGGRGRGRMRPTVYAWFGNDPAALGIKPGMTVTIYKCATRLSRYRFTARAVDDRAGDTALLFAMKSLDPKKLDHKVIFAFSTREEVGLNGAAALAAELGTSVKRVMAIDTFVTSDSPIETRRFAYAPLGDGPVGRMLDNSMVTPLPEFARLIRIAKANHIPLQWGTTGGGNDGSEFARFGAPDVAVGWAMRYSHSPVEVIDLRDLHNLARIVKAMAVAKQ